MVHGVGSKKYALAALAGFFFLSTLCSAQEKSLTASNAYIRELKAMFQRLEITDVETPPDQMDADDLKLPSFKLRNKGSAPISAPRYPTANASDLSQPGPVGLPCWKFTPVSTQDHKSSSVVFYKGMAVVPPVPLEPGAALHVASGGQNLSAGRKLSPGKYRLSVEFRPYYPIRFAYPPGPLPSIALSHPNECLVTISSSGLAQDEQKPNRKTAPPTSPKKAGADTRDEWLARNDKINQGKSPLIDAITLEKVEMSADVVKLGTPVSFTFTLATRPGFSISGPAASKPSALKYNWGVYKLSTSRKREKICGFQYVIDPEAFKKLCGSGSCVASNYIPGHVKLEPGSYELELCFWDDLISYVPGAANTKYALFKVAK